MNIIRKYKIHLLKYDSLTEKEVEDLNIIFNHIKYCKENYEIIEFTYNNLLNLKLVRLKDYPNYNYWVKDDKIIFEYHLTYKFLYVNHELIWEVFGNKFGYNYEEPKQLIKGIVEQAYKMQGVTPENCCPFYPKKMEEVYKNQLNEYNTKI